MPKSKPQITNINTTLKKYCAMKEINDVNLCIFYTVAL